MSEYLISNGTKKSYIWQMPFMELTIVDIREQRKQQTGKAVSWR